MPLATIQKIESITPIPNADKIECAKVLGWEVVVRKGEFQPNDLCIYVEIDSLIPHKDWSKFLFKGSDADKEYFRLRTIKLRGQISQGLVLPTNINMDGVPLDYMKVYLGDDVTELLGIKKYEQPVPQYNSKSGKRIARKFPDFLRKTDEVRIQSYPILLDKLQGQPYYITMKLDGTSFTAYKYKGKFGVCSRNIEMLDPRNKKVEYLKYIWDAIKRKLGIAKQRSRSNPRQFNLNIYWRIALKYNLDKILPEGFAVQGEICGPSIQGNKLGLPEETLFIFNYFDINHNQYLDPFLVAIHDLDDVPLVPEIIDGPEFSYTLEQLLEMANNLNYMNGTPAEGIVVRSLDQEISFKVISNRFLLTYGE